jgi:hypothetical protein
MGNARPGRLNRRAWPLLALVLTWAGVPAKADDSLASYDAQIKKSSREHWSFLPIRQPGVPEVKRADWVRNPIDAFILAGLESKGWNPAPPASPRALTRRMHFDLTGLPPTPDEVAKGEKAAGPEAFDRLAEELLARPTYGERWARHWLDVVRYGESNGYERDAAKPEVWRYRDYVIRSFNDDKPFDRFAVEQLAGDELSEKQITAADRVAVGFYRLGPWDDEPADPKQDRFDQLDDMVSTTSEVFLGLTLGCARCHNHKFEPLTMHDYYRMVAVVNTLDRPRDGRTDLAAPIGSPEQIRRWERLTEQVRPLREQASQLKATPLDEARELASQLDAKADAILASGRADEPTMAYVMKESSNKPPRTFLLKRGQATAPGPEVQPGVPAVLVKSQPKFPEPGEATSGRRLRLAWWIADRENPLTARVIVNRVWQHHFGEGLVRTPNDFGTNAEAPTHPELLDWLAAWFMDNGWSVKKLHKLILASNTWRMSSRIVEPSYAEEDPENRLVWRHAYNRLEAEAIRDAMLAISGQLNPKRYGPSMRPAIPKEALEGSSDPATIWTASDETEASRRTIYMFVKRSLIVPMVEVLDFCDTVRSAPRRTNTNVPTQALSLLNGAFVLQQARHLAARIEKEAGPDPSRKLDRAYLLAFGRVPDESERSALIGFLGREAKSARKESPKLAEAEIQARAWMQVCRVILNMNELVYVE